MNRELVGFSYWWLLPILLFIAVLYAGREVTTYLDDRARQEIIREAKASTLTLSIQITGEMKRIEGAAQALAGSPAILAALVSGRSGNVEEANRVLDRFKIALDASEAYLMDAGGVTLASSNRHAPNSFVGKSYLLRPYFQEARKGRPGRHFSRGMTSGKRGFYASFPVTDDRDNIRGVVAVKRDVTEMETFFRKFPNCFLVNEFGVIFLSSKPDTVFKRLWPVNRKDEEALIASGQFYEKAFAPFFPHEVADGTEVRLGGDHYLASRRPVDHNAWTIVLLNPAHRILVYKSVGIIFTVFICLLIFISCGVIFFIDRSRRMIQQSERRFEQLADATSEGVVIHDSGKILDVNQSAVRMFGYEHDGIPEGKNIIDFVAPESQEIAMGHMTSRSDAPYDLTLQRKDGSKFIAEASARAIFYKGRQARVVSVRDISERKQAEIALREAERILFNIINSLPDATLSIDAEGKVTAWNQAIETMTGIKAQDMLGKGDYESALPFYGERRPMLINLALELDHRFEKNTRIERHGDTISGEAYTPAISSGSHYLWGTATALRDSGGSIIGAIESIRDITDRKQIEEALRKSEDRLQQTLRSTNDGIWDLDIPSGQGFFSSIYYTMLGYDPYEFPSTYSSWKNLTHPNDIEIVEKKINDHIRHHDKRFAIEMRLRTKSDGWRWILSRGKVVERDAGGHPIRLMGAHSDITERKQAEDLYRTLAEKTMAGVFVLQEGKFQFLNKEAASYAGCVQEELLGRCSFSMVHPDDKESVQKNAYDMLHGFRAEPYEYRILTKQGEIHWIMETVTSILYNEKPALLGNNMKVTEKKRLEEEMKIMSLTDQLTGLYNRRGFIALAEQQLKAANRAKKQALLAFIDVDDLKWVNDTLGHDEGDNVLVETAAVLRQTFRESDIIARIGGDEFAVLAIDAAETTLDTFSKRLQQFIDDCNGKTHRPYKLAMSLGAVVYDPETPVSLDELMSSADARMYVQKKAKSKRR